MMPDQSAHQWRNLLMEVCIVPDNISSMVHAYGLRLLTSEHRHPGKGVYCENELVFSYLVERLKGGKHSESCPAEDGEARAGEGACGVSGKYAGGAGEGYWRDG